MRDTKKEITLRLRLLIKIKQQGLQKFVPLRPLSIFSNILLLVIFYINYLGKLNFTNYFFPKQYNNALSIDH
jgi:hypothetical protein